MNSSLNRRAWVGLIAQVMGALGIGRPSSSAESRAKKRRNKTTRSEHDRWQRKHIPVIDYTGPELDGYLPIIVANWNAALGGGLQLSYQRAEPRADCAGVKRQAGAIVVCNYRTPNEQVGSGETHVFVNGRSAIVAAKVHLVARAWGTNSEESGYWWHPLGCHEVGHALGLEHDFDESRTCMGTQRQTPGWMDVRRLKTLYGGCGGTVTGPTPTCCGELQAAVAAADTKCRKKTRKR
jgi:hypothetical protein